MSSNEQFPTSQSIQSVQDHQGQSHASPVVAEHAAPVQAAANHTEPTIGSNNDAPVRLPTMADLDSLAESLDQVDQTLAELDQAQVAS